MAKSEFTDGMTKLEPLASWKCTTFCCWCEHLDHLDPSFDIGKVVSHFLNRCIWSSKLLWSFFEHFYQARTRRRLWRAGSEPGAVETKVAAEDLEPPVKSVPLRAWTCVTPAVTWAMLWERTDSYVVSTLWHNHNYFNLFHILSSVIPWWVWHSVVRTPSRKNAKVL